MKILQIACMLSPDNVYGGPTTVALNQCRELIAQGHDVTMAAGATGWDGELPQEIDGVPVRLFPSVQVLPGAGFAGVSAPSLLSWLTRSVREFDVVHVHLARDLVTLPAAAIAQFRGLPVFAQTHGMIDPSTNPLAGPLDFAMTRRVLRTCARVFHLTPLERRQLREVAGPGVNLEELHNGVPVPTTTPGRGGRSTATVLYLARLQERKHPEVFVDMAARLAPEFPDATFLLVGPDEGVGDEVNRRIDAAGLGDRLRWIGPCTHQEAGQHMDDADLYVLPSVDEPYPMSVLEAMAHGLPVVITDTCGLAPAVDRTGSGAVIQAGADALTASVRGLLADPVHRHELGLAAARTAKDEFGMPAIAAQLVAAYTDGAIA